MRATLYESEGKNKMLLSRFTRYKEEIEKVQAEMPVETGDYAIQYVKKDVMERVLSYTQHKDEDIDIKPEDIEDKK